MGQIPEDYRQAAENKWQAVITALDNNEEWDCVGFTSVEVIAPCGYCDYTNSLCDSYSYCKGCPGEATDDSCACGICPLPVEICGNSNSDAVNSFAHAMDLENRDEARKQATIILEYIKNDKPKEAKEDGV